MMYTMPKNLLSICVNFALATQPYLLPFYEWLQRMINCGIITIKYGNLSG